MQIPLQVTFRNLAHSAAIESAIHDKAAKLETVHDRIQSCRVVVEGDGLHKHHGRKYNVRVDVHIPGHEFAVTREQNEDVYVAIRDAFDAARRKLEALARVRRGEIKKHGGRARRGASTEEAE
jgi:ribosome-associated translation inhibitor RaiA